MWFILWNVVFCLLFLLFIIIVRFIFALAFLQIYYWPLLLLILTWHIFVLIAENFLKNWSLVIEFPFPIICWVSRDVFDEEYRLESFIVLIGNIFISKNLACLHSLKIIFLLNLHIIHLNLLTHPHFFSLIAIFALWLFIFDIDSLQLYDFFVTIFIVLSYDIFFNLHWMLVLTFFLMLIVLLWIIFPFHCILRFIISEVILHQLKNHLPYYFLFILIWLCHLLKCALHKQMQGHLPRHWLHTFHKVIQLMQLSLIYDNYDDP